MSELFVPALLTGLFGGVHCVTMCGPIASVVCGGGGGTNAERGANAGCAASAPETRHYALAFNAGRVASYTALGFAAGAVGSWTVGHGLDPLRFALRTLAALTMLTVGLHLAGLPSAVRAIESVGAPVWRRLAPLARRLLPLRSPVHAFAAGGIWSFMPCGLLYSALAMSASAYSAVDGATTMFAFALGTLPIMLGLAAIARRVGAAMSRPIVRRLAGVVVLACGLWSTAAAASQAGLLPGAPAVSCHQH